jgi:hypothetical protein
VNEFKLSGRYFAKLYGPDGSLKKEISGHNVVTTVGKEFMASFLSSAAAAATTFTARYIAIGTGVSAESASDTGMGTEAARHTGTVSYISGQIFQVTATFAAGAGTGAITEYGLFSSATAGTLVSRDTEAAVNKGASDTLTVTYQMTLS